MALYNQKIKHLDNKISVNGKIYIPEKTQSIEPEKTNTTESKGSRSTLSLIEELESILFKVWEQNQDRIGEQNSKEEI